MSISQPGNTVTQTSSKISARNEAVYELLFISLVFYIISSFYNENCPLDIASKIISKQDSGTVTQVARRRLHHIPFNNNCFQF